MRSRYPDGHPFYGVGPDDGLHVLRNKWVQRSYVEEQSRALAGGVAAAIHATRLAAPRRPIRAKGFRIDPGTHGMRMGIDEINEASVERRMEQLLYLAYGPGGSFGATDVWGQLIAFQVPLYDQRVRNGWGHIDLMALTPEGCPVVIELKKHDAQDTPLRALVEGVANAVAVAENWPPMSREIREMCVRRHLDIFVAETAPPVHTVVLAPEDYWTSWQQRGSLGQAVGHGARESFRVLRHALAESGYPTRLASFDWPIHGSPGVREVRADW